MQSAAHKDPTPISPTQPDEYREVAWAMPAFGEKFKPIYINRPKIAAKQVRFKMEYCGICHSDCFNCEDANGSRQWPIVPGHELAGEVIEIGEGVSKFKVGDKVGVGCFVEACLNCENCKLGEENYCDKGMTLTYCGDRKHGQFLGNPAHQTWGGYSGSFVCHEHFVCKIPDNLSIEKAGPILCSGVTMWDPLRHWGFTSGEKKVVGIAGIGGLGVIGIKLAKALGHTVVAISSSDKKREISKNVGADHYVAMSDKTTIESSPKCHIILNTVSANHQVNDYLGLLAKSGTIVQLGLVLQPHQVSQLPLMFGRKGIAGSVIGGVASCQEVLDFCGKHNIIPETQTILADKIDWVFDQLNNSSNPDGIRYVIDIQGSIAAGIVPSE